MILLWLLHLEPLPSNHRFSGFKLGTYYNIYIYIYCILLAPPFFLLTQTVEVCKPVCLKRADFWKNKHHVKSVFSEGVKEKEDFCICDYMWLYFEAFCFDSLLPGGMIRQGFTSRSLLQGIANRDTAVLVSEATFTHKRCHFIFTLVLKMLVPYLCAAYTLSIWTSRGNTVIPNGLNLIWDPIVLHLYLRNETVLFGSFFSFLNKSLYFCHDKLLSLWFSSFLHSCRFHLSLSVTV